MSNDQPSLRVYAPKRKLSPRTGTGPVFFGPKLGWQPKIGFFKLGHINQPKV